MDVENGLAGGVVGVEHGPIAFVGVSLFLGNGRRRSLHRSNQRIVVSGEIVQGRDVAARNDQGVQWRLRVDIPDRHQFVILMDEASGDLPCDDLAEEAIVHDR